MKIAFIGAGKMAEALIVRLAQSEQIIFSDKDPKRHRYLGENCRVAGVKTNQEAFEAAEIVIFSVKPQHMAEPLDEIKHHGVRQKNQKLIISIAAGIPLEYLQTKLSGYPVIRAMPNNPCLVGAGITALSKGKRVNQVHFGMAERIFRAVGEVVEVPEKWMDAVTGLSGSGPAFVYLMIEMLCEGGRAVGLPAHLAEKLALQTVLGAAQTAKQTNKTPHELTAMVASPGGTTVEGLEVLKKYKTPQAIVLAVKAAAKKSAILSKRWGI